jgi:DNA-binding response OmpR family regulator
MEYAAPKKLLVIDDDPSLLKLVETLLKSKGYEVIIANEAPVGLEIAYKTEVDLIILDVMMPVINGFNICRLLKSEESRRHIPVILLTSRSAESDYCIGLEVGANAYLSKPFETKEFLAKVEEILKG